MTTVSQQIGPTRVTAACASSQKALAEDVLSTFERLAAAGPLQAGTRVRFGWSILTLRDADDGGLIVCEPDFSRDPFHETRPDLTVTLDILAKQAAFARQVGIAPVDVGFEQHVVVERGAITSPTAHLLRMEPNTSEDSGWSLSVSEDQEDIKEENFDVLRVYQFLDLRPAVLPALILPPGLIVLMEGDRISSVLDAEGHDHLSGLPRAFL